MAAAESVLPTTYPPDAPSPRMYVRACMCIPPAITPPPPPPPPPPTTTTTTTTTRAKRKCFATQQAGDYILEATAERNLADTREAEENLPGALVHLRRCRALSQRGRNAALEADVCRRLSSVYAEIADTSEHGRGGGGGGGGDAGPVEEGGGAEAGVGDGGVSGAGDDPYEDHSETAPPEAEVCDKVRMYGVCMYVVFMYGWMDVCLSW